MSELKAYELKYGAYGMYLAEDGHKVDDNFVNFVYPKDQTDKTIADLEESHKMEVGQLLIEIAELKKEKEYVIDNTAEVINRQERELRNQKRKRCLAMARWCRTSARCDEGLGAFKYRDWYWKWFKRWLAIAEKFKEA